MISPLAERLKVVSKQVKRWPMQRKLRHLAAWDEVPKTEAGYTVILACMEDLPRVAVANLRQILAMNLPRMHELILSFDCTEDRIPPEVKVCCQQQSDVAVRIVNYSPMQAQVSRRINWGWVYSWLSWCNALATVRTTHFILHDLDAIPLDRQLFETLYDNALASDADFHGTCWYEGNGVTPDMRLVRTFEMVAKTEYLRNHTRPIEAFNQLSLHEGRYVDYDTFLQVQQGQPTRAVTELSETDLVHPTQMICQHVDFTHGRDPMRRPHNLLLMPYFAYLGGDESWLPSMTEELSDPAAEEVFYRGRLLPIADIPPVLWAWLEKQARRIEQANYGHTRDVIEEFLAGFILRAGDDRSVGHEAGSLAIAEK